MLDPRFLKERPQDIRMMLEKRKIDFPLDEAISLDQKRRDLIVQLQSLKHRKNVLASEIAVKKKEGKDVQNALAEMKYVGTEISALEAQSSVVDTKFRQLLMILPNMIDKSVPVGSDEKDNVVIKRTEIKRIFDFKPKDHVELAIESGLVDLESAAKISGARFYFLKNDLVLLNQALIRLALETLSQRGYSPIQPPYMIRKEAMEGAVILDDFEEVIYKVEGEDLYLIGTSEHAMASMHMKEIIEGRKLPLRYAGYSPCFRKEAGAHGKDMKGIFRVHQFEKVEQFVFCRPEDSAAEHERMLEIVEQFYERLAIPFRTVLLCSADMGKISAKTYDIEAWMPGQQAYREIVSCSNCLDYQARRLAIRFRDKTNEDTSLVHTLNSTMVATERTIVAIIENYQTKDGRIAIPDVLQRFMGDRKEIEAK